MTLIIKLKYCFHISFAVTTIDNDANNIADTTETTVPSNPVTSTTTSDEGVDGE